ncbi:MAG: bifunctional oligoribonuclease/PAP phosphatase NrnA [Planctomycetota bacterium]
MNAPPYTHSTLDLPAVVHKLRAPGGPVLVLTHAKPDGDAFGSLVALVAALRALGQTARGVFAPPVPAALARLPGANLADVWTPEYALPFDPALCVVVDTGAWSQVGPLRPVLEPRLGRTLILDHHLSGDLPAADRYVDPDAAAACEVIAELIEILHPAGERDPLPPGRRETDTAGYAPLAPVIRDALFVGIASDTGWFRFSNVRPQTHELAAKLIRQGTDHASLYQKLEQAERPEKLALLTRALQNLSLHARGTAALITLRQEDFRDTGARPEETERLIDTPQMVGGLEVFVVATEAEDGTTRLSFRSKPASDDSAIDVSALASRFGGGGHARAAGAKVDRPLDEVLPGITAALDALAP